MITINKQTFTDEIISKINDLIEKEPDMPRRRLSLRVCEWMHWQNAAGKYQDMSCRKALQQMHSKGIICLPELTRIYAFQNPSREVMPPPITPVEGTLQDLGELELVRVTRGKLSPVWRGMLDAHHYLKSGPLCGAQIRYLVRSRPYGWIAALSFSACALRVEDRDEWIGWTDRARKENVQFVVNNSRFLIPPMVKVPGLASHILSLSEKRLPEDWDRIYGYRPVLLETYVERGRFHGGCYAGAGWLMAGTTSGIGRRETKLIAPKDIYMKPLSTSWRKQLCSDSTHGSHIRVETKEVAPRDWIDEELGRADLGDRRLTARLLKMTGQFYDQPQANIPQCCGSVKAAKAAYRFLDNPDVNWEAILRSHYLATTDRLHEHASVLVATDTTTLNFTSHPATEGIGFICDNLNTRGIIVHDTMCFTPQGTPLGLLDVQCWTRDAMGSKKQRKEKPIEQKESFKWIKAYHAVCEAQKQARTARLIMVADREGDIHELFCERSKHRRNADMLIRAERSRNRKVNDEDGNNEFLWTILSQRPVQAERQLLVPPAENRPARKALLEVRHAKVTLRPPRHKSHLADVTVWAVYALEKHPPEGVDPLEWMLLSSVEVNSNTDALERLEWYAKRWGIEVFHRILKSGCNVERRQLAHMERLANCLSIDMVVAWRIFILTMQGREAPDLSSAIYFTHNEWKALTTFVHKVKHPPLQPPTLNQAVQLLARLGGYMGRAGDTPPGSEVLWRGMARLADISEAYYLYH